MLGGELTVANFSFARRSRVRHYGGMDAPDLQLADIVSALKASKDLYDVADKAKITYEYLIQIKNGDRTNPSSRVRRDLWRALNISTLAMIPTRSGMNTEIEPQPEIITLNPLEARILGLLRDNAPYSKLELMEEVTLLAKDSLPHGDETAQAGIETIEAVINTIAKRRRRKKN